MARQARIKSNSGIYHVMIRGINKEKIFLRDADKAKLIKEIKNIRSEEDFSLIAYCIMDNHLHLLIKENDNNLAVIMKKINVRYAMYFNKLQERCGYVFQNRFRSEAVEDDKYLLGVIRYIHNNPVKASMTNDLTNYKWSSVNDYINGNVTLLCEKYINYILNLFANTNEFIKFHNKSDNNLYIDTYEEEQNNINYIVQNTIEEFTDKNGLIDYKEFTQAHRDKLAKILLNLNLITQYEVAEICNLSLNKVKEIKKNS